MTRLHAIVLAAGAGSRFGGGKLLAPFRGRPLIAHALDAALAAPVEQRLIMTPQTDAALQEAVRRWSESVSLAWRLHVIAGDFSEGMAATLRRALGHLPPDADGAFVFLGDMPRIPHAMLSRLAEAFEGHSAAAPVHQGRRGHPVLLRAALFPELLTLTGDEGARAVLDRLGPALALVPTDDPGVLFDVDTPEHLVACPADGVA